MIWVLTFIFCSMAASRWDIARINGLFTRTANSGPRKPAVELPPAPRLAVNLSPKTARSPSS